jgi:hypothetical protein
LFGQVIFNYSVSIDGVENPIRAINSPSFGACNKDVTSGEFVLAEPIIGCDALTNAAAMQGKIAVIDRGSCDFVLKARNAEAAGAIAVIICNNLPDTDDNGGLINMGLPDGQMDDVTITAYSMSQEGCAEFRALLPASGSINPPAFGESTGSTVLWGANEGEGDFNGGLNGWTTNTVSCNGNMSEVDTWKWQDGGADNSGSFGSALTPGPSYCNGFMVLNSDFLDNAGNALDENGNTVNSAFGSGDCPAPQIAELISPTIDISGADVAGVSLEFFQETRQFNSRFFVEYSIDGGENYAFVEINDDVATNESNSEFKVSVPLAGAAGASQLKIRFTYFANYYYWAIDDVKIVEREANNMRVNENFFAAAPNILVPKSQVDSINFLADVQNVGALTQDNVTLSVKVTDDADGSEVFSDAVNLGSIIADSIAENNLFPNKFLPPAEVASYTGIYTVSSDAEDFDSTNNSRTIKFGVSEDEFANEDRTNLGNIQITDPTQIPTWALGNYFYVPKGEGWKVTKFGIGISNAAEVGGLDVGVRMFKWVDIDADSNENGFPEAAPNERELIGFADYEILGNELIDDINLVDVDDPDDPILLEDDAHYIVMMTMDATIGVSAKDDLYNSYLAMNLASTAAGKPRFFSFTGDSDDIGETVYDANTTFTPLVRMYIAKTDASSVTELPADNLITASPNPATDYVLLDMDFTKSFDNVEIMMTDMAGRVVLIRELENVQKHQMRIDVSNLAAGVFNLNISTPDGVRTTKITKLD